MDGSPGLNGIPGIPGINGTDGEWLFHGHCRSFLFIYDLTYYTKYAIHGKIVDSN
jgi:hypothetical protein